MKSEIILGIESSCDETSCGLVKNGKVLTNIIYHQKEHEKFGGVVPELASRVHIQKVLSVANDCLEVAKIGKKDLSGIAYAQGPGLLGSLLVGSSFAQGLALALDIPLYPVDHLKSHAYSILIDQPKKFKLPCLCLLVSGGHTKIMLIEANRNIETLGNTQDDAAGEAYDKIAVLLGLGYPGGHKIDKNAQKGLPKFTFPKSKMKDFNYSFSGIKTAVLYFLKKQKQENPNFVEENMNDLCASVQKAINDMLMDKFLLAAEKYQIKNIGIAGGVSANSDLRKRILELEKKDFQTSIPKFEYCTDNGAMIAYSGYLMSQNKIEKTNRKNPYSKWEKR